MRSKRMRRSIIRRVLQFIPVLLGITFLAFLLIYLSPSDPVSVRMSAGGISVSPEIMESMRRSMGLDRPLLIQYGDWYSTVTGCGISFTEIWENHILLTLTYWIRF